MSEYVCNKHKQIKIKRGTEWVCPQCENNINKHDIPDFMRGLFKGAKHER